MGDVAQLPARASASDREAQTAIVGSRPEASRDRLLFLEGVRALAALFVVLHHAYLQVWAIDYGRLPTGAFLSLSSWLLYGHFAVDVFIVVSGFCLMLPVALRGGALRGGARTFFKRRALRILPPYYLAMALSLLLIALCVGQKTGTHWDVSVPVSKHGLLYHLLLIQNVTNNPQINHAFWSIAVECQIYLLFPLLVWLWSRIGVEPTLAITVTAAYAVYFAVQHTPYSGLTPHYLALFAFGMLGAEIAYGMWPRAAALRHRAFWRWGAFAIAALIGLLCWRWGWRETVVRFGYVDALVGIGTLCLFVSLCRSPSGRLRRLLEWRPLVFVGGFSYSLYLIHAPLLQVVWQYLCRPLGWGDIPAFFLLATIGTSLILAAAYLFYSGCERPFIPAHSKSKKGLPQNPPKMP